MPLPSIFLETLRRLLQDPSLAARNALFDASMQASLLARVDALTPDLLEFLTASRAESQAGSLEAQTTYNRIALNVSGFEYRLSRFRDGLMGQPRKLRRRTPSDLLAATPSDRVRYLLSDPVDGVLLLDQNLEIVRTFPGLISSGTIAGAQYADAQCAVAATIGATELLIVACGAPQHAVQILNYATGALVATIGTPGTAGLPDAVPVRLTDPVAVAVDEDTSRLFIACRTGNGTGGDLTSAGFVVEFDVTAPAAPVLVGYVLVGDGLYRLNNSECRRPSDVFIEPEKIGPPLQPARLWIANGLGDVAAFTRAIVTDPWVPTLTIEAQGAGYTLGPDTVTPPANEFSENAIDVLTGDDDVTRLYVAASRTAEVHVFRASAPATAPAYGGAVDFGAHEAKYGQRGLETSMPYNTTLRVYSTPQQPRLTFGVFAAATGVCADETVLTGESAASLVLHVADADAGRLQRLRLEVYEDENLVTFAPSVSAVPLCVIGWFLPVDATFPPEYLTLEVRDPGDSTVTPVIPSTPWREVPRTSLNGPNNGPLLTRYQFRLRARLPSAAPISAYQTSAIGVILRQAW
jgi:hypothetical protein